MIEPSFQVGESYSRVKSIHDVYGGQRQSGIVTPKSGSLIFLFTGRAGEQHGYSDGWDKSGVFHFTGEGQVGPMQFVRGNRAVRDHALNGKDLLLFEETKQSGMYRYMGRFDCANWELRQLPDREGNLRDAIVFHLVASGTAAIGPLIQTPKPPTVSIQALRDAAYKAAQTSEGKAGKSATKLLYDRSSAVAEYVLARAGGKCEACGGNAPFVRSNGTPFLECHHVRRLSDGGPDSPAHVGAVCPNCHRNIHYGASGTALNDALRETVRKLEVGK